MNKARPMCHGLMGLIVALSAVASAVAAAPAIDRNAPAPAEAASLSPEEQAAYLQRQTDGNALGLVITNYGFFGNNLVTRSPSMEYPLGSQIEHLVRAGLWVGGINAAGKSVVSTGCVSGTWGGGSASATEFTPLEKIRERSTLYFSRAWSESAKSEQDFLCSYRDYGPIKPSNKGQALTISVTQKSYLWSYEFAEAFVIVRFTVKNEGGTLWGLCLGIYAELLSGWKGAYDTWLPPSGSWFRKKMLEYFPDQRMVGEHHYTYQGGSAPSWGAFALLGAKGPGVDHINELPVTFNWWDWQDERTYPDTYVDEYRLRLLKTSMSANPAEIVPEQSDPVELVSVGPFPEMTEGDSVVFVCAFLGGMDRASLIENAKWAQIAFDNDYVLPSPPQPPNFKVIPGSEAIDLYWDDSPESIPDPFSDSLDFEGYRVYISREEGATSEEFNLVRDVDIDTDTLGYNTGFDSIREANVFDSTRYDYHLRIPNLKDGFKYWVSITSYDKGMPEQGVESMQSGVLASKVLAIPGSPAGAAAKVQVFPNPYRGEAVWDGARDREKYIWFANLPGLATIRIFTLAGDLVKTIQFDGRTYKGEDVQGLKTGTEKIVEMPGGICAWDLISERDQAVATGLYIFSVDDRESGESQVGKFMVIR